MCLKDSRGGYYSEIFLVVSTKKGTPLILKRNPQQGFSRCILLNCCGIYTREKTSDLINKVQESFPKTTQAFHNVHFLLCTDGSFISMQCKDADATEKNLEQ